MQRPSLGWCCWLEWMQLGLRLFAQTGTDQPIGRSESVAKGIMCNLVGNSIKYTEPRGPILVGCRRSGRKVRIDVVDTGIGLSAVQPSRIFQAFQRLHPARCDGLGIVLFVVRRAAELLGHEIEVSCTLSRGSRFSVLSYATRALPAT